jgi:DNA topoisomerase-1
VKELEKQGIGRPSTYAPTIGTLLRRNYVKRVRRALQPTDLGVVVTDLLVEHFPREMDVGFTSRMEEELDEIEEGRRDWRSILEEFYGQFAHDLAEARQTMQPVSQQVEDLECPECGRALVVKFSRRGDRFLGCSGFPECKYSRNMVAEGAEEPTETEHKCDKCGSPMLLKTGRRGREFLACSAFPDCRNIMGLDREGKPVKLAPRTNTAFACPRCGERMHVLKEKAPDELSCSRCRNRVPLLSVWEALDLTELPSEEPPALCDQCGAPMELKRSRKGLFLGCSKYPDCKGTMSMPKDALPAPQPTHERCEKCGRPLVLRWGQYGRFLACSGFPRCRNTWKIPGRPKRCPAEGCDGQLMKKADSEGASHVGCTRFPQCDYVEATDQGNQ